MAPAFGPLMAEVKAGRPSAPDLGPQAPRSRSTQAAQASRACGRQGRKWWVGLLPESTWGRAGYLSEPNDKCVCHTCRGRCSPWSRWPVTVGVHRATFRQPDPPPILVSGGPGRGAAVRRWG